MTGPMNIMASGLFRQIVCISTVSKALTRLESDEQHELAQAMCAHIDDIDRQLTTGMYPLGDSWCGCTAASQSPLDRSMNDAFDALLDRLASVSGVLSLLATDSDSDQVAADAALAGSKLLKEAMGMCELASEAASRVHGSCWAARRHCANSTEGDGAAAPVVRH